MSDAGRVSTWEVWLLPPDGGDYSWRTTGWVKDLRIIPLRFNCRAGNTGTASFQVLNRRRQEQGSSTYRISGVDLMPGQWVLITCGNVGPDLDWTAVRWWGKLTTLADRPNLTGDYPGDASGSEAGSLFDSNGLSGWRMASGVGPSIETGAPTTFNLNGINGEVIGNRITDSDGKETLCRIAGDCGVTAAKFFTRYRLLNYTLTWLRPPATPQIALSIPSDVQTWLDDTASPEVLDPRPMTFKGALDLCIPRSRGLGWRIALDASGGWALTAWSLLDDGETGVPVQTPVDIDPGATGRLRDLSYTVDESAWYDEVIVRGAPILIMGSLAASDSVWVNKWTAAQQTAWATGSTASIASVDGKKEACSKVREAPHLRDVFVAFGIGGSANSGHAHRSATPGTAAESLSLAFVPLVVWGGAGTPTIDETQSQDPPWTGTTLERQLPWRVGVQGDGTDGRDTAAKAQPTYLEPRVFIYDASLGLQKWRDLLLDEGKGTPQGGYQTRRPGASLEVDERGPNLRVRCSPPEYLARGDWAGIMYPRLGFAGSPYPYAYDWRTMVVTIALRSGQRLEVVKRRAGITAGQVRRRLVLEDEKLQAWYVHAGTVLGLRADGTVDSVTAATWTRNDYPTAEKRARAAAAWALATRYTASISLARPDLPPAWAALGTLIGTITNGGSADAVNTAVEDITVDLGASPSITITTDLPELPDFAGGGGSGGPSPQSGGPVSLSLGGTISQAVAQTQTELARVRRDLARVPVLPGRHAPEETGSLLEMIEQTAHGLAVGTPVRHNGTIWVASKADTPANAVVAGLVVAAGTDHFIIATGGRVYGLTGLAAGAVHYLATGGGLTTTAPAHMVRVLFADSTSAGILFLPSRVCSVSTSDPGSTAATDGDLWFKY